MIQKHFVRLSTLIFFCFAALSTANAASENLPQVDLNFEKSIFGFNETVPVRVSISNTGESEIKILRWITPVDGVKGNLFSLTLNGRAVEYTGAIFKRAAPTEADYLTLQPGETIVKTVNLADYYDLSQNGYYQITYRAESYNLSASSPMVQQKSEKLKSEGVTVWVYGTAKKTPPGIPTDNFTTTGCNATQSAALPLAVSNSNYYASNSYNYLNAGTLTTRYTNWFGAFTSTRYATVKTHFSNIRNLYIADNYRIACNDSACQPSYFAFVYPTDTATHTIYVCNQFWLAAVTGTDSKAGTLIHEISHFNDIAGTNDFVYGQSGAMSLAVSNPDNAVNNADNHEYFAEASPLVPTAASVSVSGRVLNGSGRGIAKAFVSLTDQNGNIQSGRTNSFGYYRFEDVQAGQTATLTVVSKQFHFAPQIINLNEEISQLNFVAEN